MLTSPGEGSVVGDFAAHILNMFRYDGPDRVIRTKTSRFSHAEVRCTR